MLIDTAYASIQHKNSKQGVEKDRNLPGFETWN